MPKHSRSVTATPVVAILVAVHGATFCVPDAHGQQLRINSPVGGSFGGITSVGRIANTGVSRSFGTAPGVGARPGRIGPQGVPQSPFYRGKTAQRSVDLIVRSPAWTRANAFKRSWRNMLGPSGAARYFGAAPVFQTSGLGAATWPSALNGRLLLDPRQVLATTSFASAARARGITSGGVRDILSLQDDSSSPRYSSMNRLIRDAPSQSSLMKSRLTSMRTRYIAEAWDWFQRGEYQRANSSFQNAELLDRSSPEPRVGVFFCCVAEGKFYLTVHSMGRLIRWDGRRTEMLDTDYKLRQRYQPLDVPDAQMREKVASARISQQLNALMRFADDNPTEGIAYAALTFGLWHTGYFSEAVQTAKTLQKIDPDGAYGQFGTNVLEALARKMAAAQTQ